MATTGTSPRKLLLWDIDGTLFFGDRVGQLALGQVMREAFGIANALDGFDTSGRTEHHIAQQLLRANALDPTHENIHVLLEAYVAALEVELPRRQSRLLPGVLEILETVAARRDLAQGLLTGNLQRCARLKLERFDAWRFFPFGAFGEDGTDRNELGPHAIRRATDHHLCAFDPALTFVIGDTPHDIACGQAVGAFTIGVATGRFPVDELKACRPTAVLRDLADAAEFFRIIDTHPAK